MNLIPKVIHQTWKKSVLPEPFDSFANTWQELHPSWDYILWTDEMNRDFIKKHFPNFLPKYDKYPSNIQRVDAFRYLLLCKIGGVYIDIDIKCLKNIEPILGSESCVIGKEPKAHCEEWAMKMILCNAFMASTQDNKFMQFTCDMLMSENSSHFNKNTEVLLSTGPFLLTKAYSEYDSKNEIKVLNSDIIYPLTKIEVPSLESDNIPNDIKKRLYQSYAVHYFWGSWW